MLLPPGLTVPPMMTMGPGAVCPAMVVSEGMFSRDCVSQPLPFASQPETAARPRWITPLTSNTIVRGPVALDRPWRSVPGRMSLKSVSSNVTW